MKLRLGNLTNPIRRRHVNMRAAAAKKLNEMVKVMGERMANAIPPVPPSKIKRDMTRDPHMLAAMTSIRLKKKGIGILKSPRFGQAMNYFLRFKMGSSGYMRGPWSLIADGRGKKYLGIKVSKTKPTSANLSVSVSFTMAMETNEKRSTAKARFRKELQPILNELGPSANAGEVLKAWKD